jgi:hypothetical protein
MINPDKLNSSEVNTSPVTELPEITRVRFSAVAEELKSARTQAYIEANFGIKALEIIKMVMDKFL